MTFNYNYFCHLFVLIYIVYRRWRCLRFLECIYSQYAPCYQQSFSSQCLSADILLSVWSFYLITFTVQDIILFWSELSFKWPYTCRKMTLKRYFTYLLTYFVSEMAAGCDMNVVSQLVCVSEIAAVTFVIHRYYCSSSDGI